MNVGPQLHGFDLKTILGQMELIVDKPNGHFLNICGSNITDK